MKVKLSFKQIVDIANLNIMTTGFTHEDARRFFSPYTEGIIIDAEPIQTEIQISTSGAILAIR